MENQEVQENLRNEFKLYDMKSEGFLSPNQLTDVLSASLGMSNKQIENVISKCDLNSNSNKINYEGKLCGIKIVSYEIT